MHAGGLRIDHVMGLFRQFWLPPGAGPDGGAYVRFPAPELLDIVAIEASRQGAFVIGEDLGTVEPEVSAELRTRGILGTTLGWFEDVPPSEYEPATLAALTTHDLPTAAGVVTGADSAAVHRLRRRFDGSKILRRLEALTPTAVSVPDTIVTAYRTLATAPTRMVLAQVDDAVCALARPNLPGTVDEWPNWCLPLPSGLEDLRTHPTALAVAAALNERPWPSGRLRAASDRRTTFAGIGVAVVLGTILRTRFLTVPLNTDEAGFAEVARLWSRGEALYGDVAWVDRPQGLLLAYRLVAATAWDPMARLLAIVAAGLVATRPPARRPGRWPGAGPPSSPPGCSPWSRRAPHLEGFTGNGELLGTAFTSIAVAATAPGGR